MTRMHALNKQDSTEESCADFLGARGERCGSPMEEAHQKMQRTYQTQSGEQGDEEEVQVVEQQSGCHPST